MQGFDPSPEQRYYWNLHYGMFPQQPLNENIFLHFNRALLIISGADGELSAAEWDVFVATRRLLGIPMELLSQFKTFDYRNGNLEESLKHIEGGEVALIYDAIKIASADGYADAERAMARKAAEILKINICAVVHLEYLVAQEYQTAASKKALFTSLGAS